MGSESDDAGLLGGAGGTDGGSGGEGGAGAAGAGGDGLLGGAGAGEGGAGEGERQDGGLDPDWFSGLSIEGDGDHAANRDFAKAKGWKTPDDVVKSYREAEKALRDSGRVKIPGENASGEEIAAFRKALGVPDDAKGYVYTPPNDAEGNPVPLDTELLDRISATAHKFGIPKAAMEAVVGDYVAGQLEGLAASEGELKAAAEKWVKDQGARSADRVAAVKAAVRYFEMTLSEQLSLRAAWGAERSLEIMAKIGEGLQEDTLLGDGKRRFGGLGGTEAQARLDERMKDSGWMDKALVPGTPENAEYRRLNDAIGAQADRQAAQAG